VRGITRRLSSRIYIGCVRVRDGETPQQALQRRQAEHEGGPKRALWLKICTGIKIHQEGEVCTSVVDARRTELWTVAQFFHTRGFSVRGGPFSSITLGPTDITEIQALADFASPSDISLNATGQWPMSLRHMRGECFTCGKKRHQSKDCAVEHAKRRVYEHNPAEFPPLFGCYWHTTHGCYQLTVYVERNKRRKRMDIRVYVREQEGRYWLRHGNALTGTFLGHYDHRWQAVQFAREECLQIGSTHAAQFARRRFTWAPRSQ